MAEAAHIAQSDLVFIIGTSLKVFPFNHLVNIIPKSTPVVLLNFDNPVSVKFDKFLFLEGDIDTHVKKILGTAKIDLEEDQMIES